MLGYGGSGVGHSLQEGILRGAVLPQHVLVGDLAAGVDVGLARAGRAADGQLLQRTAVAAHGVTLKVDKNQHTVVVFNVLAQVVDLQHLAVLDRPLHVGAFGVHDVHVKKVAPAVLFHQLDVLGGFVASTAVSGVALDHGAMHGVDDRLHELRVQVVLVTVLAAVDLDGDFAGQFHAQLLIHFHDRLRRELVGKVNGGFRHDRVLLLKIGT